jgi:CRISPR-associated protein Cas2
VDRVTFFIYDITNDKVRNRVIELLKDFGLSRFQYSAFRGRLTRARRTELWAAMLAAVEGYSASMMMLPVSESDLRDGEEVVLVGNDDDGEEAEP